MNLDLSRMDAAQRIYDSQVPEDQDEPEQWPPMPRRPEPTDLEVDQFIAEFAERGFFIDEVGERKTESLYRAVAKQYSQSSVGSEIGPVLFKWAKSCVQLGCWF